MKQLIISFILSGFILGCQAPSDEKADNKADGSPKLTSGLDSTDYEVISSAIKQFFVTPPSLSHRFEAPHGSLVDTVHVLKQIMLLLIDSTSLDEDSISMYVHQRHAAIDSSDRELTEKILEVNKTSFNIDNAQIESLNTQLVSSKEIEELLDDFFEGYEKVYEKHPNAYGIVTVSKPAYNQQKDKAIIYIAFNKAPDSGHGVYMWLKKQNGEWIAYDLLFLWES